MSTRALCVFCKHFSIDMGWGGTDVTPGESARIECLKDRWSMRNGEGEGQYRRYIAKAETCSDFVAVKA